MCIFNIALAATGSFSTSGSGHAALAFLLLWVVAYALSTGPIGFISAGEISTPRLRGKTTSFSFVCYSGLK
jgi:SP family general alpha glucoside:H+ symporter-like MFS transporter